MFLIIICKVESTVGKKIAHVGRWDAIQLPLMMKI